LLFSQLWNLENNCSYIHSSAVDISGKSIVFTADSGVGKSSLLLRLSELKRFKFIADDLTIISGDAKAFYQGRCLSVKPYHLSFFPFLKSKLKTLMGGMQSLQWKVLKENRLTFRLSPFDIFNEISEQSSIKRVIHLCNYNEDKFAIKEISAKELLEITIPIFTNELFLAHYKLNILASLPNSPFNSSVTLLKRTEQIYFSVFEKVNLKLVLIPYKSNPNDLYHFLKTEGCLN